jgi:NADH-quinone oxidoreductase subunit L
MIEIAVIVPMLFASIAALIMGRKHWRYVSYVAVACSLISLILVAYAMLNNPGSWSVTWFAIGGIVFPISTVAAPLNLLLLALIAIITPLVLLYSMGYMRVPSEQGRYYFEICAFAAAMMLFAISSNLITMFIGWEMLGLTSYLLIGFWRQKSSAVDAGIKVITIIFIGDMLMLGGIILMWVSLHTFSFAAIASATNYGPIAYAAMLLIIIAAFTKSAQFPFHEWLADAMEGPTPVSAFLHSSTMVKAGVFLMAVMLPVIYAFRFGPLLIVVGTITAVIGALNAASETHIKRILAYSTIEDLGLMVIALGFNSIAAAMMLFTVQTFYKAQLFMDAGYMMEANNENTDIKKIAGPSNYKRLLIPSMIGAASLAGIFPLSGFFGKAAVDALAPNIATYLLLSAISLLSSFYIFRWLIVPLKNGKKTKKYAAMPHSMIIPIYVLSALIFAASAAYLVLPYYIGYGINLSILHSILFTAVALAGIAVAFVEYRSSRSRFTLPKWLNFVYTRPIVNAAYNSVVSAVGVVAEAADSFEFWAYTFISAGAHGFNEIGSLVSRVENGRLDYYLVLFVAGVILIFILMVVI